MRHAVVTGTSSGIGLAIARRLLADDWRITGLDLAPPVIEAAAFTAHPVDLADPPARSAAIAKLGRADGLVHAAGIMRTGPLGALDPGAGELMWRLTIDAAAALADALVPTMPSPGRVVLIGSRTAAGAAMKSQYAAAKAGLTALARSWAKEVVARGITVNVVAPAATETAMTAAPARAGVPPVVPPMGRLLRPQEIAALVAFLMSEDAAAITGQEIVVCGGASL